MPGRTTAASRRSTTTRSSRAAAPAPRRRRSGRNWTINGEIIRIILGTVMLILGIMLLIGLFIPSGGVLTNYIRDIVAPWFGTLRWLLPFILLLLGYYLYRAQSDTSDWQLNLLRGGGVGKALADFLAPLVSAPGAGLILSILVAAGLLLALDMSLPAVMAPMGRLVSRAINALFRPAPQEMGDGTPTAALSGPAGSLSASAAGNGATARTEKRGKEGARPAADPRANFGEGISTIPVAIPNPGPLSQTFAPPASASAASRDGGQLAGDARDGQSIRNGAPVRGQRQPTDAPAQSKLSGLLATAEKPRPEYHLPPRALLEDIAPRGGDSTMDHRRNAAIIVAKLASFNIPARVAVWNAGPVVTQYEVEPSPEIKVSRIEALSDDLAMALAAPTIRIEAPIPGKSVVGLEIPNKDPNIVQLGKIFDEVDLRSASKLTFALGRDVAGRARATDLARMPHLLIAGATGSGKSVMVNALITSLLCKATPDEVRLVLMDLKRVELSAYNGLPHLMIPVITEPERAKAALKWAVNEMENRYRRFAGANARNLAGYNETRADPADRMSYLVIIIDELADLMMREGKNVEEPIVRLAQKARATGIHLVLATQRPSVNVVTGLIKANFPSRIAFAMASQIDSRTILDMPGAEDLIGRGDMLFQPADVPRPIRLQGVFVSDEEIAKICEQWRAEAGPQYDMSIVDTGEEPESAEAVPDEDADRLLFDAMGVIQEYDRASASLLQRRLKIGYARAARIMDQLEARGYIGPFDGSNARQVLRRDIAPSKPAGGYGEVEE